MKRVFTINSKPLVLIIHCLAITLLSLQGCSLAPVSTAKPNALVVAQTITNTNRIVGPIKSWNQLVLWPHDNTEAVVLEALPSLTSTQEYVGMVPAGSYTVGLFYAKQTVGNSTFYAKSIMPPSFATFYVKPGVINNLGSIIYHPFAQPSALSQDLVDFAVAVVNNASVGETIVNKVIQQQAEIQHLRNTPMKPINLAAQLPKVNTATVKLIQESGRINGVERMSNADLYAFGQFGLVENLTQSKTVYLHTNQQAHHIHDLLEYEAATWLAAGEDGFLVMFDSQTGKIIQQISQIPANQHIFKLFKFNQHQLGLITMNDKNYQVYSFDLKTQALTNTLTLKKPSQVQLNSHTQLPIIRKSDLGLQLYFNSQQYTFNQLGQRWIYSKDKNYTALYSQPNGLILRESPNFLTNQSTYEVLDSTISSLWLPMESTTPTGKGLYKTQAGQMLRLGSSQHYEALGDKWVEQTAVPVLSSTDNGKSWQAIAKLPLTCDRLVPAASLDTEIVVICGDQEVMLSTDFGKTWQLIRQKTMPKRLFPLATQVNFKRI